MAESSYPSGVGTRVTTDPQYEALGSSWATSGVYGTPNDTAVVYADGTGTRVVKIRANKRAIVRGWGWASGTSDISLASLAANASGSTRIDTIVLRFNRATYTVTLAVVQGTGGAGNPALTQSVAEPLSSGTFEVPLATVSVANGATTINSGNVTNVAWYVDNGLVMTTSTAAYQPPVNIGINRYKHYDTGIEYELYAGAWRRTPWNTAWGYTGGQRYVGGAAATIVVGGTTSEFASAQSSGAVTLRANRRYKLSAFVRLTQGSAGAVIVLRLRETNVSGTIRAEKAVTSNNTANVLHYEIHGDYAVGGSDEVKTLVVTGQSSTGLWNLYNGDAGHLVAVFVDDVGPASTITSV